MENKHMARYRGKFEEKRNTPVPRQTPDAQPQRKKPKHRKGNGWVTGVLLVFFSALIVLSGWKLLEARQEYAVGEDAYAALVQAAVKRPTAEQPTEQTVTEHELQVQRHVSEETPQPSEPIAEDAPFVVDFELLTKLNNQVVGWISDNAGIDYPVVQGSDNDYYLTHLVDGTVNKNGSIFVDYRNTPGFMDKNTFIYGHNMLNGTMFAGLSQYGTAGYYAQHPEIILDTPEGSYSLQVFSGYVTPGNSDSYQLEFRDDAEYEQYLEKVRLLSDFASDVTVTGQDRIVTLSTCTYDYDDARYVVHCKLVPMQS